MTLPPQVKAAAYVRMSTDHQQYSTNNQLDTIKEYAARRGFDIIQVYSDEGRSGLRIEGRDALKQLIADAQTSKAKFAALLVYDVSRWGRFQDADESAYYEYILKQAGIRIYYCAEQFENDGSPVSTIVKGVKRAMAGEYSRELSAKVFQGACRLIEMGFKQGGTAGFGLRRMLVDQQGNQKGMLKIGEHKSIQTDRVILVPGPANEVEIVREMYQLFIEQGKNEAQIADILNARGVLTDFSRPWTRGTVHEVLTNEKYIGNNIYHRTSCKLKKGHVANPSEMWVRKDRAFKPVVTSTDFYTAQGIILARSRHLTDEEMLQKLKTAFDRHGRISGVIIDEEENLPSSSAYRTRFGSLVKAYELVGYTPAIDYGFIEINKALRAMHPELMSQVRDGLEKIGAHGVTDPKTDLVLVNGGVQVSIVLVRCAPTPAGTLRWVVRLDQGLRPDLTIAVRMEPGNKTIRDYLLLPSIDATWTSMRTAEYNGLGIDAYRFDSLDYFFQIAEQCQVEEVA